MKSKIERKEEISSKIFPNGNHEVKATDVRESLYGMVDDYNDLKTETDAKLTTIGSKVDGLPNTKKSDACLAIGDKNGYNVAMFENGHIKTKDFDSSADASTTKRGLMSATDKQTLEENKEDVATLKTEQLKSKKSDSEWALGDKNGNNILAIIDGYIKTRNFDSSKLHYDIDYPAFVGMGMNESTGAVIDADNRVISNLIRVRKNDVVSVLDKTKIGGFFVIGFSTSNNSARTEKCTWTTDDYVIQSEDTQFIRIMCKPATDATLYTNSDYVYNVGVVRVNEIAKDNVKITNSTMPCGWYVSTKSEFSTDATTPSQNTGDALTLQQIYDNIDTLANAYTDYITIENLGKDASNTYDVKRLVMCPNKIKVEHGTQRGNQNNTLPTIYMDFGIHGNERPAVRAMLNFLIHLCRDWQDNAFLTYLRWNVRLVVIPVANPHGYANETRQNANNVDLNRNFNGGGKWVYGDTDPTSSNYKGTAPFSEVETKYIARTIMQYADAVCALSFHTHGKWTSYEEMTSMSADGLKYWQNDVMLGSVMDVIKGVTLSGWKNHKLPTDSGYIGEILLSPNAGSFPHSCADWNLPTSAPECFYRYYNGSTGTIYNTDTDCLNEEFVCNLILCTLRQNLILK